MSDTDEQRATKKKVKRGWVCGCEGQDGTGLTDYEENDPAPAST